MKSSLIIYGVLGVFVIWLLYTNYTYKHRITALETEAKVVAAMAQEYQRLTTEAVSTGLERLDNRTNNRIEELTHAITRMDTSLGNVAAVNTRLRNDFSDLRDSVDTGVSQECRRAAEAVIMYSDVFGECTAALTEVGGYADAVGIARDAGEEAYGIVRDTIK